MSKRLFIYLLGLCVLLGPAVAAQAQGRGQGQDQERRQQREQPSNQQRRGGAQGGGSQEGGAQESAARISRSEASALARRHYSGRVLNIQLQGNRWRLRIDDGGTLINVFVDAGSGEVSGPGRGSGR